MGGRRPCRVPLPLKITAVLLAAVVGSLLVLRGAAGRAHLRHPLPRWHKSARGTVLWEFVYAREGAQTVSAHGTTLVNVPGVHGGIIAAWFGGSREGAGDVEIYSSTRFLGGEGKWEWSVPRSIAKASDEAHWNPVMFWVAGELHLHYKVGDSIPHWRTYLDISRDGAMFHNNTPRELVPGDDSGGRGAVKNKPLLLPGGDIIAGASHEAGQWRAFTDVSVDGGLTWARSDYIKLASEDRDAGLIQPALWRSAGLHLHMLLRSDAGWIFRSDSTNGGRTWGRARRTKLGNNNSGLDVVMLAGKGGERVLVVAFNPSHRDWGPRYPLRLGISYDNGETWPLALDVETGKGEFSYPAVIPWESGEGLHMTYTWNRMGVRYFSISLVDLLASAVPMPANEVEGDEGDGVEGEGEGGEGEDGEEEGDS